MYGSPDWLGTMQTLLLVGFTAAMVLTVLLFRKEPEGRCDIHRCPKQDCRKMHTRD